MRLGGVGDAADVRDCAAGAGQLLAGPQEATADEKCPTQPHASATLACALVSARRSSESSLRSGSSSACGRPAGSPSWMSVCSWLAAALARTAGSADRWMPFSTSGSHR